MLIPGNFSGKLSGKFSGKLSGKISGKKDALASVLFHSGILKSCHLLQNKYLICLSFHRIKEDHQIEDSFYPFCDELFGPSESQFYQQMKWIKKNAYALSEQELLESVEKEKTLPPRSLMITFDDAYLDNYRLAYPILKSLNLPAMYFVPTEMITDRRLGWWDITAYLIKYCKNSAILFRGISYLLSENPLQRTPAIRAIQELFKTLPADQTQSLLQELALCCEVNLPPLSVQSQELMSWEQVQEVSKSVIQIGSHTHSHRVLATLDLPEQLYELRESRRILEEKLQKPIQSLAIPVGGYEHFTTETQELGEEAGYSPSSPTEPDQFTLEYLPCR